MLRPLNSRNILTVFATLLLVGCGGRSDLGNVSGLVTLDGKPLPSATVVFQPDASGPASYGLTDAQGRYSVMYDVGQSGAVVGMHTVKISTYQEKDPDADPPIAAAPEILPDRYNKASELRAEV
ncbi:MAG TPA: hypothetical protein DCF63_19535, partial [Planctomycetaceae bacterium]|nr:hypothetical protein [Planctomycetaceae bacterium]